MNTKPRVKLGTGLRRLEELEPRRMLAGNGFATPFVESGGAFFAAAHSAQAPSVAPLSEAFRQDSASSTEFSRSFATFGGNRRADDHGGGDDSSSSTEFTASLSDSDGDTATVTYQTGDLLGTSESVITVSGDTLDEGTSVALSINGMSIGTVAIDSSGSGTLIVPSSGVSTTVAAGSTVALGASLTGSFTASTTGTSGGSGGCGGDSSSDTSFSAALSDSAGDTATVTFQTGKLLGTSESVITVTGDTLDEGTSVALSINGTSIGTVVINSSGSGTLVVPSSSLSTTVASGSTITLGSALTGTFAASTSGATGDQGDSGGCGDSGGNSSSGTSLSASLSDSAGDTATVTYQVGKLLGTSESVITVTGDTLDEGTSVALTINGASVGTIAVDSSGAGSLTVATSSLSSTVASGSTVTLGTSLNGTFASSTVQVSSSSSHVAHETVEFAGRHRGRG